jgi:LysM repeat protein
MKNIIKILIVAFIFIANQVDAQDDIYIKYDMAYMDKYQYKVENLSSQDFHVAYHIYTSASERIILNTSMNSYQELNISVAQSAIALTEVDWSTVFINQINNGSKRVHLVFNNDDAYQTYQVSTAIFVEETDSKLMYSGSYYSYTFDKNKDYGFAEDLAPGVSAAYDEAIFMTNNGNSTNNCLQQYGFIKIIKETHPKGSFTMIANDDFTSLQENEIVEICQSALYVDFVENIGIVEERTKNGSIVLIGINGQPTQQYIAEKCQIAMDIPTEYSIATSANTESVQPVTEGNPGLNFIKREEENTNKSGAATADGGNSSTIIMNPAPTVTTNNTETNYGKEGEYELVFEMLDSKKQTVTANTQKQGIIGNGNTHIVDNGETLYGISKKYGMSVEELQDLNNLETLDIFVTQVLIINKN